MALVRILPNRIKAIEAVNLASELLEQARIYFEEGNYEECMNRSRDAVRVASSALLFGDGFVASTFEDTLEYIKTRYPAKFPINDWMRLENVSIIDGIKYLLLSREKKKEEARYALTTAERVVGAVIEIFG